MLLQQFVFFFAYLNDFNESLLSHQIIPQYYKQYRPIKDTHTGLETSILGINILVAHAHFIKGKLKVI